MRHRSSTVKLGRTSGHRKALLANMATSLFAHERIRTTLPKAKAVRSFAERLITTAKKDTLHARRLVARVVRDPEVLSKVFKQLGPRYAERPGGYTRIYKLGFRRGDSAEMAYLELVDRPRPRKEERAEGRAERKRKLVEREGADAAGGEAAAGEKA
jgi:large subunit ribosomal protein L17